MNYKVYFLCDPITEDPKYVGQTVNSLETRFKQHLREKDLTKKSNWIQSLLLRGLEPLVYEIKTVETREEANELEIYWIQQLRCWGFELKNHTEGGQGIKPTKLSENHKKLLSKKFKGKNNPFYGKKHTPESIAKIVEKKTGMTYGEDFKARRREIQKDWKPGEKMLEAMRQKTKKPVVQLTKNFEFIKEFDTINLAKEAGFNEPNITACCKGRVKSHRGFIWMYKKDFLTVNTS